MSAFVELNEAPADGITSLVYHPQKASLLLATSWDKTARLYDTSENRLETRFTHLGPVFDSCFVGESGTKAASVGVDRRVRIFDVTTGAGEVIGEHNAPIRNVRYSKVAECIVTGSWDKTVRLFDLRSGASEGLFVQPEKVFALDVFSSFKNQYYVVVGMAGRKVYVYDLRKMSEPVQRRESSLIFQTRTLRCMSNGEGFVMTSIEGRVAVEYIDPSKGSQARKFAFKCHRHAADNVQTVYSVNGLAFHPTYETFATGGADGLVYIWDPVSRRRIRQFRQFQTGISALAFNSAGKQIAVGCSYTWEEGDKPRLADAIYIRDVQDTDVCLKKSARPA